MTILDVDKIAETWDISDNAGSMAITLNRTYQVISDDRNELGLVVATAAGIPAFNSKLVAATGHTIYCKQITPRRVDTAKTEKKWNVTTVHKNLPATMQTVADSSPLQTFSADEVEDPTLRSSRIRVDYEIEDETIEDATLVDIQHLGQSYPRPPTIPFGYAGPVINTAGDSEHLTRPKSIKVFQISKIFSAWDSTWDSLIGRTNSDTVTLTRSDDYATRATWTYAADQLQIRNVRPQEITFHDRLYFDVTFVVAENTSTYGFLHRKADLGLNKAIFAGQYKNLLNQTADQYAAGDLADLTARFEAITDINETPITDPIRLNGYGAPDGTQQPKAYFENIGFELIYRIFYQAAFNSLGW